MEDLFWPGDRRADPHLTPGALVDDLVRVEAAWLDVLAAAGLAPDGTDLTELPRTPELMARVAHESEASGNPVTGLVELLRDGLRERPEAARWVHRGLTSQDVLDTALMLGLRGVVAGLEASLADQIGACAGLVRAHRETPMVARTLTQHAVPTTFGLKAATWLGGLLDARDECAALVLPVQLGGAAGTMAALTELGLDPVATRATFAARMGLADAPAWHTRRTPVTRAGDALTRCSDAFGRIANDVLALSRPEIGELSESGGGGSSTMPGKANPVRSVLVRRAALAAPALAATLHLAAADQVDERAAGAWHLEWATLRTLARHTLVAAAHTLELLAGLQVHPEQMAATLASADVRREQRAMAELAGHEPTGDYLGAAGPLADEVLARASKEPS